MNVYETDKLLGEYLLFHYGTEREILTPEIQCRDALFFPVRCVAECLDDAILPASARALDLGCAVGRSSFELARSCAEVIGIDASHRFIDAASELQRTGRLTYRRLDEGALFTTLEASVPPDLDRTRVAFETGDAQLLRNDLGEFDVVLMANLIDRLRTPKRCLAQLPNLVKPGGQLVITSPYTWLEEFTPQSEWLGGFESNGARRKTRDGLQETLGTAFEFSGTKDLPFLIREHARKFQLSVAEVTLWRRRD